MLELIASNIDRFLSHQSSFSTEEKVDLFETVVDNLDALMKSPGRLLRESTVKFLSDREVDELYKVPGLLSRVQGILENQDVISTRVHNLSFIKLAMCNRSFNLVDQLLNLASQKDYSVLNGPAYHGNLERVNQLLVSSDSYSQKEIGSALEYAAVMGHLAVVKVLSERIPSINRSMIDKVIVRAIQFGHLEVARFLFEELRGSDLRLGLLFMCVAIRNRRKEIVKYFVEQKGVSINPDDSCSTSGAKPLKMAIVSRDSEIVQYLLDKGADLESRDEEKFQAIHHAVSSGQLDIVRIVKEAGARLDVGPNKYARPLCLAAKGGHKDIVEYLMESIQLDAMQRIQAMTEAAGGGYLEIIKLLDHRTISGADLHLCAFVAASKGDLDIVRFFFERQNFRLGGDGILHVAAKKGHKNIVEYLVEQEGIDPNAGRKGHFETAFEAVVIQEHTEVIEYFIRQGIDLKVHRESDGFTLLHVAARHGRLAVFEMLAEAGLSFDVKDKNNRTPFHIAAIEGHRGIMTYLIRNGVNPEAVTENGETTNHIQAYIGTRKRETSQWQDLSDFGAIITDLRQVMDRREVYKLTFRVKGKIIEDEGIRGVMRVSRLRPESLYQYIFEMVLGFEGLRDEGEILRAINNGKNYFSNPASQLAHAVSGMTFHVEIAGKNKDLFEHGPKLLLEAYGLAREKDDLKNFFNVAFNKNNVCIDARLNLLSDYIERTRLGFDPEFEIEGQRDVVRQLYDYLRVFTNLQVREASNQLGLDYKEAKDAINQETATEELKAAYQELFTFERFKDFVSENPEHLRYLGVEEIDYKVYSFAEEHFTS